MITALVTAAIVALIQAISHRLTQQKLAEMHENLRQHSQDLETVRESQVRHNNMLSNAVAQLPRTRSKKGAVGECMPIRLTPKKTVL